MKQYYFTYIDDKTFIQIRKSAKLNGFLMSPVMQKGERGEYTQAVIYNGMLSVACGWCEYRAKNTICQKLSVEEFIQKLK